MCSIDGCNNPNFNNGMKCALHVEKKGVNPQLEQVFYQELMAYIYDYIMKNNAKVQQGGQIKKWINSNRNEYAKESGGRLNKYSLYFEHIVFAE